MSLAAPASSLALELPLKSVRCFPEGRGKFVHIPSARAELAKRGDQIWRSQHRGRFLREEAAGAVNSLQQMTNQVVQVSLGRRNHPVAAMALDAFIHLTQQRLQFSAHRAASLTGETLSLSQAPFSDRTKSMSNGGTLFRDQHEIRGGGCELVEAGSSPGSRRMANGFPHCPDCNACSERSEAALSPSAPLGFRHASRPVLDAEKAELGRLLREPLQGGFQQRLVHLSLPFVMGAIVTGAVA